MSSSDNREVDRETRGPRLSAGVIVVLVLVVAFVVFIAQNTEDAEVTWLFFDATVPLWLALLAAGVVAVIIAEIGGWLWRRSRRPEV